MMRAKKDLRLKFSTAVVVTACFLVVVFSMLISQNLKGLLTMWGEDVQLTVYLSENITSAGRDEIENILKSSDQVAEVSYISQQKALSDFRSQMASYAPDLDKDPELLRLIPSSFQVKISSKVMPEDQNEVVKLLANKLMATAGVDDVSYGQEWLEKYGTLVSVINHTLQILGVVILMSSLFVMSNVVSASVFARREEIAVFELIGASKYTIRKPFILEGAVLGLTAALAALVISFLSYVGAKEFLITKLSFLQLGRYLSFLNPEYIVLFVLIGGAVGAVGSYICVRQLNDGWAAKGRSGVNS